MMVKRRVHDLVSQGSGQSRRVQGFNKIRVVEERHSICGHRLNRPALAPLQAEQKRAEEGMVQDQRGARLLNAKGGWCLMSHAAAGASMYADMRVKMSSALGPSAGSAASRLRNRPSISATMLAASAAVVTRSRSCFLRS